jgi:hypothetical protein
MRNSTKRILSILGVMVLFIASLIVFTYLIQPSYSNIVEKRGEISGKQKLLSEYKSIKEKIDLLNKDYQNVIDIKDKIQIILPNEANYSQVINQINGLAEVSRSRIENLNVKKMPIKQTSTSDFLKGVGVMQITTDLIAPTYGDFIIFMGNLEKNLSLMDLTNLKIESVDSKSSVSADNLRYSIEVNTYYQDK